MTKKRRNGKFFLYSFFFLIVLGGFFIFREVSGHIDKFEEIRKDLSVTNYQLTKKNYRLLACDRISEVELDLSSQDTLNIYYWATWCQPCIQEMSMEKKRPKNMYFITLEDPVELESFAKLNLSKNPADQIKVDYYHAIDGALPFEPDTIRFYPTKFKISNDSIWRVSNFK
jgi:hypothetical protein